VAGWALDPQADLGSGIGAVHVWAQRRDVPGAERSSWVPPRSTASVRMSHALRRAIQPAGYNLVAEGLSPGRYDITVFAWNRRTGRWEDAHTITTDVR